MCNFKEKILEEQYSKFIIDSGISSIMNKKFPLVYQVPVLFAMDIYGEQEARTFANFILRQDVGDLTIDELWENFKKM